MDHVKETRASIQRRHRRRRAAITLTIVGLLMVGAFWYAATYFQGWVATGTPRSVASSSCHPVTAERSVTPNVVTINVYNATDRAGLAAAVAKSLQTQGFKVARVTNDPLGKSIDGVGEVRRGQAGTAGGTLAATRLAGAKVVPDGRTDDTVDLVLGNSFTALSLPPTAAPSTGTTPKPTTIPSC